MAVGLLDRDEADKLIRTRINDDDWWVIGSYAADPDTNALAELVESRFYTTPEGRSSADFELIQYGDIPICGITGVYFAHKRRMSAANLALLISKEFGYNESSELYEEKDVLVIGPSGICAGAFLMWGYIHWQ